MNVAIPMHKHMLQQLDREAVEYKIIRECAAFADVVEIEIPLTDTNILYLFHAGVHVGMDKEKRRVRA